MGSSTIQEQGTPMYYTPEGGRDEFNDTRTRHTSALYTWGGGGGGEVGSSTIQEQGTPMYYTPEGGRDEFNDTSTRHTSALYT